MELHGLDTESQIFFYEQDYYVFSNFSSFQIDWEGVRFATSEQLYHWLKFANRPDIQDEILLTRSAHDAFRLANDFKEHRRPDWDFVKFDVMVEILRAKTRQHNYVKKKLIDSGSRELIENSWRDDVWGWGVNRDGQNLLGKAWMKVRDDYENGRNLSDVADEISNEYS